MTDHEQEARKAPKDPDSQALGKEAKKKLIGYVIDPRVYIPIIAVCLGLVTVSIYSYFQRNIARHVAHIVSKPEYFQSRHAGKIKLEHYPVADMVGDRLLQDEEFLAGMTDKFLHEPILQDSVFAQVEEHLKGSETFPSLVVEAIIDSGDLRLKRRVRELIQAELRRLEIIEAVYGRVDQVIRHKYHIEGGQRKDLASTMDFFAELGQQVSLRLTPILVRETTLKSIATDELVRPFTVKGGAGEKVIRSGEMVDITDVVDFLPQGLAMQLVQISFWPERGVPPGEKLSIDTTVVVRNRLPGGEEQEVADTATELPID